MAPISSFGFLPFFGRQIEGARPAELLGISLVTGSCDESGEFRNRNFMTIDKEWLNGYFVGGRFIWHAVIGAHQKFPALDENHLIVVARVSGRRLAARPG